MRQYIKWAWTMWMWGAVCLSYAQPSYYLAEVDLRQVENDQLLVRLQVPSVEEARIEFHMPRIVPGTYSISNFGRFITQLSAFDAEDTPLSVTQLDTNRWEITEAQKLAYLTYLVDDTFDADQAGGIFQPAGTNIEEGKNFFINTFGFFGYLDGYKDKTYRVTFHHDASLYGSTSLKRMRSSEESDTFEATNYFELADNPLLYAQPDTAWFNIANTKILVSIYAQNGGLKADAVKKEIQETLAAQASYLGGILPVEQYSFLIYTEPISAGSFGALEHAYSSMYYLPEPQNPSAAARMTSTIQSIAAHEFFHIVTPLTIHSEEIGNFDFINTKMSKHLWLYEGVTEYFANHALLVGEVNSRQDFIKSMQEKIQDMSNYQDTLPFTEMSTHVLDRYADEYQNVYQKGAIIGLCLDILLREYSNGEEGLIDLLSKLGKKYGKDQSFKDEELFEEIASLSDPRIRTFFEKYVEGPEPLPLADILPKVGIGYKQEPATPALLIGNAIVDASSLLLISSSQIRELSLPDHVFLILKTAQTGEFQAQQTIITSFGKVKSKKFATSVDALQALQLTLQTGQYVTYKGYFTRDGRSFEKISGEVQVTKGEAPGKIKVGWIKKSKLTPQQIKLRESWLFSAGAQ